MDHGEPKTGIQDAEEGAQNMERYGWLVMPLGRMIGLLLTGILAVLLALRYGSNSLLVFCEDNKCFAFVLNFDYTLPYARSH